MLKTLTKKMLGVIGAVQPEGRGTSQQGKRQPLVGERVIEGVPIYDVATVLAPHAEMIEYTRQISQHQGRSGDYTFDTLFMPVIEAFARYAHHLPASESHHHNYPGGLLAHSLQVANRAIRYAKSQHLGHIGMLDKEPIRLSRYLFAAWTCGLLHDAGKIYSDIRIIDVQRPNNEWLPLVEDLVAWAARTKAQRYVVKFRNDRIHKRHETVSLHLLQQVLPKAAKTYISTCPDDLFTEMSEALTGYESRKGYLQDAIRTADHISTAQDLRTIWDKTLGPREASLIEIIIKTMQHLMPVWRDHSTPHMVVLANEVYLRWPECMDGIISSLATHDIACPTSVGRLHEVMVDRGLIRGHIGERVAHFYEGVTDKSEALRIILGQDARDFVPVVRLEWAFHAVGNNVIPQNQCGLLKLTKEGESLLFGGPDGEVTMISLDDVKAASASLNGSSEGAAAPVSKVEQADVPAPRATIEPAQEAEPTSEQSTNTDFTIELAPSIDEILNAGGKPVKSGILRLAAADVDPPQSSEQVPPTKKRKAKGANEGQQRKDPTKGPTGKAKKQTTPEEGVEPVLQSAAGEVHRVTPLQAERATEAAPSETPPNVNTPPQKCPWHRPNDSWCEADGFLEQLVGAKPANAIVVTGDTVWVTEASLRTAFGDDTQDVLASMIRHRYLAKPVALPHLAVAQIPKVGGRGIVLRPHIGQALQGLLCEPQTMPTSGNDKGAKGSQQIVEPTAPCKDGKDKDAQAEGATPKRAKRAVPALTADTPPQREPAQSEGQASEAAVAVADTTPVAPDWNEWLATWLGARMADADVEPGERAVATAALRKWGLQLGNVGAISRLREREGIMLTVSQFMTFTDKQPTTERQGLWKIMACMTRCGRTEATANSKVVIVEASSGQNSKE